MNKSEFTRRLSENHDLSSDEASRAVKAFLTEIENALADGEDVSFAGFGKFSVSDRAARTGVNPQDPSKKVDIPARAAEPRGRGHAHGRVG
jgi:DNA-binding protein HU-beta